jgi:hypothetical protein
MPSVERNVTGLMEVLRNIRMIRGKNITAAIKKKRPIEREMSVRESSGSGRSLLLRILGSAKGIN